MEWKRGYVIFCGLCEEKMELVGEAYSKRLRVSTKASEFGWRWVWKCPKCRVYKSVPKLEGE